MSCTQELYNKLNHDYALLKHDYKIMQRDFQQILEMKRKYQYAFDGTSDQVISDRKRIEELNGENQFQRLRISHLEDEKKALQEDLIEKQQEVHNLEMKVKELRGTLGKVEEEYEEYRKNIRRYYDVQE